MKKIYLPLVRLDIRNFQPWYLSDQMWFEVLEVKLLALALSCVSRLHSKRKHSQKCTRNLSPDFIFVVFLE